MSPRLKPLLLPQLVEDRKKMTEIGELPYTFFTTTNWKAKITKRLQAGAGPGVTVSAPDVVIRVSSSKSFSASATAAIPKAKATHTVRQGEHDINFIESTPFNKRHY